MRFDFTLNHVLEIKIGKANRLSKQLDWKVGVENDKNNQVFIKNHWICNLTQVIIEELKVVIIEKAKGKNEEVVKL